MPTIEEARRGNLGLLQEYLSAGVSCNALDKSGCSALHAAAQGGHVECVQALLDNPEIEIDLQVNFIHKNKKLLLKHYTIAFAC